MTEAVKFDIQDVLASDARAVIVGQLATRIKATGDVWWFRCRPEAALAPKRLTRGGPGGQPSHRKSLCLGIPINGAL
jgi:hypothetical protein